MNDHNREQWSPSQPKSGNNNVEPSVIKNWDVDGLEIEVTANKVPKNMVWLEEDAALTVESAVKKRCSKIT